MKLHLLRDLLHLVRGVKRQVFICSAACRGEILMSWCRVCSTQLPAEPGLSVQVMES